MLEKVITISREFGSGGRELGILLAKGLEIPFYDKELIALTAEECGMTEESLLRYDERIPVIKESLEQQIYTPFSNYYEIPMSDQVFLTQTSIIRKLADQGPCIIVGRCADRVLEDSVNLYIYAGIEERIRRLNTLNTGVDPKEMEQRIRDMDRKRKEYYQYYTGCEWGKAQNYHLCLDSSMIGLEGCYGTVMEYLKSLS
nr:cytidylate kinase-like family protein [Lacrimispora aerotolerans]